MWADMHDYDINRLMYYGYKLKLLWRDSDIAKCYIHVLIDSGLVMPYDDRDRCQAMLWWHQAITWTYVDLSAMRWHFARGTSAVNHQICLESYFSEISFKSPRYQWVKQHHLNDRCNTTYMATHLISATYLLTFCDYSTSGGFGLLVTFDLAKSPNPAGGNSCILPQWNIILVLQKEKPSVSVRFSIKIHKILYIYKCGCWQIQSDLRNFRDLETA